MKKIIKVTGLAVMSFALCFTMQGCKNQKQEEDTKVVEDQKEKPVVKEEVKEEYTLTKLIETAMEPVGETMYIWGGGWNEEDTGSGIDTRRMGVSKRWKEFYEQQNSGYNFQTTMYQIHDGLDCSGYIGWILYNVFEKEDNKPGYVSLSGDMIDDFVSRGWGTKTDNTSITNYECGDILANDGHVFLVLAQCDDGSLLIAHSAPPGVRISGTPALDYTLNSEAVMLADQIMSTYYPDWYQRYPECAAEYSYLMDYDQFRWNDTLKDVDHLRDKTAEQLVDYIFNK